MKRHSQSAGIMIAANAVAWVAIHMALAWAVTRLPLRLFDARGWLFQARRWEHDGDTYESVFHVQRWKSLLPDGALLFVGGFAKGKIARGDQAYLERFVRETCRGESAHWLATASSTLFFFWNPLWAGIINVFYGCLGNVPCIIALRYNRLQLLGILARHFPPTRRDNAYE
jgi:glycosyl-4,4'-diaponeurosporenoate acyltransferase